MPCAVTCETARTFEVVCSTAHILECNAMTTAPGQGGGVFFIEGGLVSEISLPQALLRDEFLGISFFPTKKNATFWRK